MSVARTGTSFEMTVAGISSLYGCMNRVGGRAKKDLRLEDVYRLFLCLSLGLFSYAEPLQAWNLGTGLAMVEEGDEIQRPALLLQLEHPSVASELLSYGRRFGEVTERTMMLSFSRQFPIYGSSGLSGILGASLLDSYTAWRGQPDISKHQFNLGPLLGICFRWRSSSGLYLGASWEASVFPAGLSTILLVTGRVHSLSLSLGAIL